MLTNGYIWTNPGGGRRFQVSLVPRFEQRFAKHTLNNLLKISKTDTLFTVFPTKSTPFHYGLSLYFIPNHRVVFIKFEKRKPTLFPLKCHFSDPKRWQRCALPNLKKVPFLIVFFCSSIRTKLTNKRPAPHGEQMYRPVWRTLTALYHPPAALCPRFFYFVVSVPFYHHTCTCFYVSKLGYIRACEHIYTATKIRKVRHICMSHWKSGIWVPSWSVTSAGRQSSLS